MSWRTLLVPAIAVLVLSNGYTQTNLPGPGTVTLPNNLPSLGPTGPAPQPPTPRVQSAPPTTTPYLAPTSQEKSLDQMLDELESLRAKKAALEKAEQELVKTIQLKVGKQAERLKMLGVVARPANGQPQRVGRIFIEGNDTVTDGSILKIVKFSPGQVLEMAALETARTQLMKGGFSMATIEVMPHEPDATYVDLLIKVVEKEK